MKKLLFLVLALAAVSYFTPTAQAVDFELAGGQWKAHLTDAGSTTPTTVSVGAESRSVFTIDDFDSLSGGTNIPMQPNQLNGLSYDLAITADSFKIGSLVVLYFGDAGRKTDLAGLGGRTAIYQDMAEPVADQTYSHLFSSGPASWIANGAGVEDQYPNVNDAAELAGGASLWLSAQFVPIYTKGQTLDDGSTASTNIYLEEIINTLAGTGSSLNAYMDVTGGSEASLIAKGGFTTPAGLSADVSLAYTFVFPPDSTYGQVGGITAGKWPIQSSDPALIDIIPEPATFGLLSLALAGLGVYRKRQK